jgi:hypothetical protein
LRARATIVLQRHLATTPGKHLLGRGPEPLPQSHPRQLQHRRPTQIGQSFPRYSLQQLRSPGPFGRVTEQRWIQPKEDPAPDVVRDNYAKGHDRMSNRFYRENFLSSSHSELYHANADHDTEGYGSSAYTAPGYDGLDRLKEFRRGPVAILHREVSLVAMASSSVAVCVGSGVSSHHQMNRTLSILPHRTRPRPRRRSTPR